MKTLESGTNFDALPERQLGRRSFLKGIMAISAAAAAGCEQTVGTPISKESGGLVNSLYPRVYKILMQKEPQLVEQVNQYLQDYLDQKSLDRTRFGTAANHALENEEPMNCITVMTESETLTMQSRTIAYQLYLDLQQQIPWSLEDLSDEQLKTLCDTSSHFAFRNPSNQLEYRFYPLAPSYPEEIFAFLREQKLIKPTHQQTIESLIDWFREHAMHFQHIDETDSKLLEKYEHLGAPTIMDLTGQTEKKRLMHIQGCFGSVEFFKQVLQTIGIPTKKIYPILDSANHTSIQFPTINKAVYHGDDLHSYWSRTYEGNSIPPGLLLVEPDKVPDCKNNSQNCLDIGYNNHLHSLDISEKYLTEKELLYQAYFLTGSYAYPLYSPEYLGGTQLPPERLQSLYERYRQKLLEIGKGDLLAAINILSRINARYENE